MKPDQLILNGRFRVLRHLGGGGMSQVYLGEQLSLGRKVAIKVLRRDIAQNPIAAGRFLREAQLLSTVDHPAVVRVIDFEQDASNTFLVLELVEGVTLEGLLAEGPLELGRALYLLTQLAEGLAAIHHKGIVHRDVKPQNVVITAGLRGEQARLLDFGIARLAEAPDGEAALSVPGQVVGTPAYLSPEQATGAPLDARTDVYSFGVMAFQALTGALPLPGPSAQDFMLQHLSTRPRRLEEAAPALRNHPELCALISRCLEKNPDRRPIGGKSLLAELVRLPPSPTPPSPSETPDQERTVVSRRNKGAVRSTGSRLARQTGTALRGTGAAVGWLIRKVMGIHPGWRPAVAVVAALVALAPVAWHLMPKSAAARAQTLLEAGRADEALSIIDGALLLDTPERPDLIAMKAAALHQLKRHQDEAQVLTEHLHPTLYSANPLLLRALAEDFARDEADPVVREFLANVPAQPLQRMFVALAQGPLSSGQWGALRYLDDAGHRQASFNRVGLYSRSLASNDCETRAAAAKRLAELGEPDAIPALRRLSETPKEDWTTGGKNCGQDEAAESIRALNKRSKLGAR